MNDVAEEVLAVHEACELVVETNAKMAEHYEAIRELATTRGFYLQAIMGAVGNDMLSREQKTKTVGRYVVEVGMASQYECLCHALFLHECPDQKTAVEQRLVRELKAEPHCEVRLRLKGCD